MWKKTVLIIGEVLTAALVTYAVFINCCTSDFIKFSIGELIAIIIAVLFAFYATQFETDQRKMKENAERLLGKMQLFIGSESFWNYSRYNSAVDYKDKLIINNRNAKNTITILGDYANIFKFEDEYNELKKKFSEYEEFVGDKIADLEYLKKSAKELRRQADRMNEIIEKIYVNMYK